MEEETGFKCCPMCGKHWGNRNDFLNDDLLILNGYQADFEELEYGLFYFTHQAHGCGSTLVIQAKAFLDLYSGAKYSERKTGSDECPGYCLEKDQLSRCDAACECAFIREVIEIIKQKHGGGGLSPKLVILR